MPTPDQNLRLSSALPYDDIRDAMRAVMHSETLWVELAVAGLRARILPHKIPKGRLEDKLSLFARFLIAVSRTFRRHEKGTSMNLLFQFTPEQLYIGVNSPTTDVGMNLGETYWMPAEITGYYAFERDLAPSLTLSDAPEIEGGARVQTRRIVL